MEQAYHPWANGPMGMDVAEPTPKIEVNHLSQQEVETLFKVLQLNPQVAAQASDGGVAQMRDLLNQQEYQRRLLQLRNDLLGAQHQPYDTVPSLQQGPALFEKWVSSQTEPMAQPFPPQGQGPALDFQMGGPGGPNRFAPGPLLQPSSHPQAPHQPKKRANGGLPARPHGPGKPQYGAGLHLQQQQQQQPPLSGAPTPPSYGGPAAGLFHAPQPPPLGHPALPFGLHQPPVAHTPLQPLRQSHHQTQPQQQQQQQQQQQAYSTALSAQQNYHAHPDQPWMLQPGQPNLPLTSLGLHGMMPPGLFSENVDFGAPSAPGILDYGLGFSLGLPRFEPHGGALLKDPVGGPMGPRAGKLDELRGEPAHAEYYPYPALELGGGPLQGELDPNRLAEYASNFGLYSMMPQGVELPPGVADDLLAAGGYDNHGQLAARSLGAPATAQTFKLLKSLQTANTQAQVVEVASQLPAEHLDVVSICTIMNRLAKVSHNKCPPAQLNILVARLLKRALTMVDLFEHQHASNILHAVAKLNIKDTRFISVMKERIIHPSVVNELNPQDIANTVWALATLRTTNNKLIDVLTQRAMVPSVLNQFNSQHVTNIAWAMAKLGIVNTTLLNALADRAMCPEVLNNFNAQGVANTVWACAKSGFVHLKLMNALAERAMHPEVMNKFISQNLANIAWGWAKLALLDERLMHALADRAIDPTVLEAFNTQEVANMSWAFARLGVLNEPLLLALAERAMHPSVLNKYTSQDLGNTSWAFAKLGVLHEPLMDALAERSMCPEVAATFNTQNVANVAWAFARLGIRNVPLLSMLAQRSMCRPVMYRFKPHQIGNTAWSFAKLGILNKPLMDALAKRAMDPTVLTLFQAQDIANVLWAYATLDIMTPQLKQRMEDRALDPQVLATFSQQDIATTVMAYAKMNIHTAELLEALGRRALEAGILQESPPNNNDDW